MARATFKGSHLDFDPARLGVKNLAFLPGFC
jgi:hypothetical protein